MQKIQILFPDPLMRKLREFAKAEDVPVSEVVRRGVERHLLAVSPRRCTRHPFPTFKGGGVLLSAGELKQEIYSDDEES